MTTPSPISDQAAGEPIAWLIRWPNGNEEVFMDLEIAKQQAAMFRTKPVPLGVISTAPTTGSAPVATLHDDGYYTFHGEKPHGFNYQGWRMDVYAAPASPEASKK